MNNLSDSLMNIALDYESILLLPEHEQDCSDIAARIMAVAEMMMEE